MAKRKRTAAASAATSSPAAPDTQDEPVASSAPIIAECPYTVEFRSGARKTAARKRTRKAPKEDQELDQTLPEDSNTVFCVRPDKQWDKLKKYRNFVVGTETFALNEYVFINHDNIPHATELAGIDDTKFWVARVLEIKAEDEAHVYLRVYWMYWPDELPEGRQPYHGAKELVASNHMEIVDAMTVSGRANVRHWMELDEDEEMPDLFWRQKFDCVTQTLKEIRRHCRCKNYYNPDKLMIGCPACGTWLHEECIVEDIKARVVARGGGPPKAAEEQSEEDASAEETISVTKAPLKRKSGAKGKSLFQSAVDKYTDESSTPTKSETPAPATPATNGKSGRRKNKAELKTKASDLEKLEVMYNEGSTKVHVRDLRGVKKAKANRAKKGMQGEGGGGEEGVVEWDEDVVCLCCGADIE